MWGPKIIPKYAQLESQKKRRKNWVEKIVEEIMAKKFPKLKENHLSNI